jgi:hypothetical protein
LGRLRDEGDKRKRLHASLHEAQKENAHVDAWLWRC